MRLTATFRRGNKIHDVSVGVPDFLFMGTLFFDPTGFRPSVFRDFRSYTFSNAEEAQIDFRRYVNYVNHNYSTYEIDRLLSGLMEIVDEHINQHGRILFPDLLMYVDCMAVLYFAANPSKTEEDIAWEYPSWVRFVVGRRSNSLYASTIYGVTTFEGSINEADLESCFDTY